MNVTPPSPIDLDQFQFPEEVQAPFPAPSEPLQYRAIGIIHGRYEPSEERLTQGKLLTPDGVEIDAVLLGRVLSLVRKHLDLSANHPWVVYPRTRDGGGLHTQIVGVWSLNNGLKPERPESALGDEDENSGDDSEEDEDENEELTEVLESDETEEVDDPIEASEESVNVQGEETGKSTLLFSTANIEGIDGFFSIRGEVSFQSQQEGFILLKIRQQSKKKKPGRAFKLRLEGILPDDARGKFWDLEVRRLTEALHIEDGTPIATLPKPTDKRRGGPRRPGGGMGRGGPPRGGAREGGGGGIRPRSADRGEGGGSGGGLVKPDRSFRPPRES